MLTRVEFQFPQQPKLEKLTENEKKLLQYVEDIKKAVAETFRTLNRPDVLVIDQATINDSAIGGTTAAAGTFTDLTSTGNTTLGNASTDTLNVGNGGIIKDASGNVGIGITPATALDVAGRGTFRYSSTVGDRLSLDPLAAGSGCEIRSLNFGATAYSGLIVRASSHRFEDGNVGIAMSPSRTLDVTGTFGVTGISTYGDDLRAADGSATTPSYSFTNSTGTGMYLVSAGVTGFAAGGTAVYSYTNTGLTMASGMPIFCAAAATGNASIRLPHGTAPSIPVDGDMWTTTAGLYVRINGSTVGPLS